MQDHNYASRYRSYIPFFPFIVNPMKQSGKKDSRSFKNVISARKMARTGKLQECTYIVKALSSEN